MKELFEFIWKEKSWWLIPPILMVIIATLLIFLSTSTPISPFIYALF